MTDLGGLSARIGLNPAGLKAGRAVAQAELLKVEGSIIRTERASHRLGGSFGRLGTAGKVLGGVLGFELARKAGEGLKVAVEYAVDLEATMARVQRVFGDSTEHVVKFSDTADRTLGRTKDQALTAAVRFGTLATRLGQTKEEAAKTSVALTKLAVDLAASKGGSADDAGNALATGMVGRGMALRRYGIVLTDATLKEEALREGLLKTKDQALTPAIKMQTAYNTVLRQTTDVQGYFSDHLDLVSEKQQVAAATTKSASEALGKALIPAEKALADILANDVAPALKVVGETIGTIADHKVTRDVVVLGGGLLLVAKVVTTLHKALLVLKADTAEMFGAHTAAAGAIEREGVAAATTTVELGALAAAQARVALGAGAVAESGIATAAGASAMSIPGLGAAGTVGTAGVATAGTRVGAGGMLAAGIGGYGAYQGTLALLNHFGSFGGMFGGLSRDQQAAKVKRTNEWSTDTTLPAALKQMNASGLSRLPGYDEKYGHIDALVRKALQARDAKVDAHTVSAIEDFVTEMRASTPRAIVTANDALTASGDRLTRARHDNSAADARGAEVSMLGGSVGGMFDDLPSQTKGDPAKASAAAASARLGVKNAEARVAHLGAGSGGASRSSILSAQASVVSAEQALAKHKGNNTAQTLRLQAAESRLASLRAGSKLDTGALARAEDALAIARKKSDTAAKASVDASSSPGLGVSDLMAKVSAQLKTGYGLKADTDKLIKDGVSRPVLENLIALEKTAPGTMSKVAHSLTKAQARGLNAEAAALQKVQTQYLTAPLRAAVASAESENAAAMKRLAQAQFDAYQKAMRELALGDLALNPGNRFDDSTPGSRHGQSRTTNYNMPGATIVAGSPAELAKQLEAKARTAALSGQSGGHGR